MKNKHISAALVAGILCISVLNGCSPKDASSPSEGSSASRTSASSEASDTIEASDSSEVSDTTEAPDSSEAFGAGQETTDEADEFSEYDFPNMGLTVKFPSSLTERMNQNEMAMLISETYAEDGSTLEYALIALNLAANQPQSTAEDPAGTDSLGGEMTMESAGVLGVYQSGMTDRLDELTGCDEHREIGQSPDGAYTYYLSINTKTDKEVIHEMEQIRTVITEMASLQLPTDDDVPTSSFSGTSADGFTGTSIGDFTTQDINGKEYTQELFEDYDLTLVNIFTTWCSPCVAEIPDLEKLYQQMADQGVNVVGVVLDVLDEKGEIVEESLEKAQLLAEKTGATYPILLPDSTYFNGRLTGIEAVPETFFVDRNGNIVGETYSGSGSLDYWLSIVEKELANVTEGNE